MAILVQYWHTNIGVILGRYCFPILAQYCKPILHQYILANIGAILVYIGNNENQYWRDKPI